MSPSCSLAYALVLSGPVLAFIYAISVLCFLAMWHECSWCKMNASIALRLAVVCAAVASSVSLCETEASLAAIVPVGVLLWLGSIWLLRQTRVVQVDGPRPRFETNAMKGKVVLITGSNAGIGKETARQLLAIGATIIMACRSESRARDAMDDILKSCDISERKSIESRLHFLALDLSDFESVRMAVRKFQSMNLPLHVLINNAGIMMGTKAKSKDGHELMMQANHLGHFLLTLLLLPKLQETKGARVLTVTSCTYVLAGQGFDFDDMFCDSTRPYALFGQYAQTKLANILFCKELASRYPKLISLCIHPGLVRTDVVRNMPWWMRHGDAAFGFILSLLQKTPAQGAYTSVWSSVTKDLPPNGSYLVNSTTVPVKPIASNDKVSLLMSHLCGRSLPPSTY
jgi:retinol dehydrogenase-12